MKDEIFICDPKGGGHACCKPIDYAAGEGGGFGGRTGNATIADIGTLG